MKLRVDERYSGSIVALSLLTGFGAGTLLRRLLRRRREAPEVIVQRRVSAQVSTAEQPCRSSVGLEKTGLAG